jgi:hypothetical protein
VGAGKKGRAARLQGSSARGKKDALLLPREGDGSGASSSWRRESLWPWGKKKGHRRGSLNSGALGCWAARRGQQREAPWERGSAMGAWSSAARFFRAPWQLVLLLRHGRGAELPAATVRKIEREKDVAARGVGEKLPSARGESSYL